MAYESPQINIGTLTAAADLSGKQYHFVKLASESTVNVCAAVTDVPIGVLQNTPASGESAVASAASPSTSSPVTKTKSKIPVEVA